MGGRAAWPTVRHLADKLGTPSLQGFLWMLGEVGSQFGLEGTLRFGILDDSRFQAVVFYLYSFKRVRYYRYVLYVDV